jgi:GntR family transcriptional regulator
MREGASTVTQPAYERVADALRDAILAGDLPGRLPSLTGLADRYRTTVDVARRAVEILRVEGLVVTRHGAGSYVRRFERIARESPGRLARAHWGAGEAIQDHDTGTRPRSVDVVVGEQPAPAFAAEALRVEPGAPVLTRSRRFVVEGRCVQLAVSYLPLDIVGGTRIAYTDVGPGGTYARLAEMGHAPVRFTERVTARAPRPDEVERLELGTSVGALVVEITRCAYAGGGRCVEVTRMVLDATAYELVYNFDA